MKKVPLYGTLTILSGGSHPGLKTLQRIDLACPIQVGRLSGGMHSSRYKGVHGPRDTLFRGRREREGEREKERLDVGRPR